MKLNKYLDVPYGAETKAFRDIPGNFVLSPSAVSKFYDNAGDWWKDRNGEVTFDGNTNTVLGNAVHAAIDAYWDGSEVTEEDVTNWMHARYSRQMSEMVEQYGKEVPKVDIDTVLKNFMPMFIAWQNEYAGKYPKPDKREFPVRLDMQKNIISAGTVDGYEEDRRVVIDYKTTGKKPSEMSKAHELQMLDYAFSIIADGGEVDSIRVVYIQKPTKKIEARIWIFEKEVTDEMLFQIVEIKENMKKSINAVAQYPDLADVIFRDNPLSLWN